VTQTVLLLRPADPKPEGPGVGDAVLEAWVRAIATPNAVQTSSLVFDQCLNGGYCVRIPDPYLDWLATDIARAGQPKCPAALRYPAFHPSS
jgi:hypothetical protein